MAYAIVVNLVKGSLCEEVIWRSVKSEGASFYNYESKRVLYKIQKPWSMHCVYPRKQSPASFISPQTLRTQRMCLLQCLPEDALISYGIQRRKICFLLLSRLGEFSLQIFCGFIKLNQK